MADLYVMMVDGRAKLVDLGPVLRRHRDAHLNARAGPLGQAAACFADDCLDPMAVWDAGAAAGMSDSDLDAAAYVAVELAEIERLRR